MRSRLTSVLLNRRLTLIVAVVLLGSYQVEGQTHEKKRVVAVYAGLGPNYYFNNLVLAKNKVNELNYSFVGRIMWEPGNLLSLGFETGYNRFYSVDLSTSNNGTAHIVNAAIPIQLVISMKFLRSYYANFTMGQSMLLNRVGTSNYGRYDANVVSLGDFGAAIGYRKAWKPRFTIGGELKGYYSSKLDDKNIALVFVVGYKL